MGNKFKYGFIALTALCIGSAVCANTFHHKEVSASAVNTTVDFTGNNPVVNSQMVFGGQTYWITANTNSGVTFDAANNKIRFVTGGYLENMSAMYGISSITLTINQGSVKVYVGWESPSALETTMYECDGTYGVGMQTLSFSKCPTYFRVVAQEQTVIAKISVSKTNAASTDADKETVDNGLENLFVDCGSLNRYANTSFSSETAGNYSYRSLKVTFKNTTNNYAILSPERDLNAGKIQSYPDLTNSTLTLKAKFTFLNDQRIQVKAVGEGWTSSNYFEMDKVGCPENGWQKYSINFGDHPFENNNKVIRLYFNFPGVNSSVRKENSIAYLDDIQITHNANTGIYYPSNTNLANYFGYEQLSQGLENATIDNGQTDFITRFDQSVVRGFSSETSLKLIPDTVKYPNKSQWFVSLATTDDIEYWRFDEGVVSFDYKPVNITNKTSVTLRFVENWDSIYTTTVTGVETTDGWYRASFNLNQTGFSSTDSIKMLIGFNIPTSETANGRVYLDNVFIKKTSFENYTQGWENMYRDQPFERCNASYDTTVVNSDQSINSLKLTFDGVDLNQTRKGCTVFSPSNQKINLPSFGFGNVLSAHFMFSSNVTNTTVRLMLADSNWKYSYYDLPTVQESNGWRKIEISANSLTTPYYKDTGAIYYNILRIGFGFPGVNNTNANTATVWVDDVQWTESVTNIAANCEYGTIYTMPNSDNRRRNAPAITSNKIRNSNPLSFVCAKNSVEGAELLIKANTEVTSVNFMPGKLTNTDGSGQIIQANAFDVSFAKYVYNNGSNEVGNWITVVDDYPDALVPIDRIIAADEDRINAGHNQMIWVNVNIPKEIKSGTYTGNGVLTINQKSYTIPMSVEVKNYTLTDENHARSSFLIWYDQMMFGEGLDYFSQRKIQLSTAYYNFLVDYRINPQCYRKNDGLDSPEKFGDFIYENVALNPKVNSYRINVGESEEENSEAYREYFHSLISKQLELCENNININLFDCVYLNPIDEPNETKLRNYSFRPTINAIATAINAEKDRLDRYPELKASFTAIRNICAISDTYGPSFISKYIKGRINTPCPEFDDVHNATNRNYYLNNFDHVWWYGCVNPEYPYPSLHVDAPAYSERVAAIMQYYYGFEGELYWCVNFTSDKNDDYLNRWEDDDKNLRGDKDVWNGHGITWGSCAGDGRLVYPGSKYNILGPISTLRLEQLRLARQDYEYMYAIDHNISLYNRVFGTSINSVNQAFTTYNSMFTGTEMNSGWNSSMTQYFHKQLLDRLNTMYN